MGKWYVGLTLPVVLVLIAAPVQSQPADEANTDPAPSGREETETTVYPDGISISMPGRDSETPASNPVDWGDWEPGHDDDTTVVFDPPSPEPSDPPEQPEPDSAPEPETKLKTS